MNKIILNKLNFSIDEISKLSNLKINEIIKFFFLSNLDINYYSNVNYENLCKLLDHYNLKYEFINKNKNKIKINNEITEIKQTIIKNKKKIPIISIFGNVDNGKTHLLENLSNKKMLDKEPGFITQDLYFLEFAINKNQIIFIDTPGHEDFNIIKKDIFKLTDLFIIVLSIQEKNTNYINEIINFLLNNHRFFIIILTFCDKNNNKTIDLIQKKIFELSILNIETNIQDEFLNNEGNIDTILISNKNKKNIINVKKIINNLLDIIDLSVVKKDNKETTFKILSLYYYNKILNAIIYLTNGYIYKNNFIYQNNILIGKIGKIINLKNEEIIEANYYDNRIIKIIGLTKNCRINELCYVYQKKQNINQKSINIKQNNLSLIISNKAPNIIIKVNKIEDVEVVFNIIKELKKINIILIDFIEINDKDLNLAKETSSIILCYKKKIPNIVKKKISILGVEIYYFNILYKMIEFINEKILLKEENIIDKFVNQAKIIKIFKLKDNITIFGCNLLKGTFNKNHNIRVFRKNKEIFNNLKASNLKIEDKNIDVMDKINKNFGILFNKKDIILKIGDILIQY